MRSVPRIIRIVALPLLLAAALHAQVPAVGTAAPAFKAENQDGVEVAFPPAGHWAVLAFYPKASTPG